MTARSAFALHVLKTLLPLLLAGLAILVTLQLPAPLRGVEPAPAAQPAPKLDIYGDPLPAGAVARLGSIRLRHAGPCEFYPSSDKLFSWGMNEDIVRIWEIPSGKLLSTITRDQSRPVAAAVSAEGAKLVVGWLAVVSGEIRLLFSTYDAHSLELAAEVDAGASQHRYLTRPRLCNDDQWLLAYDSQAKEIAVWDLATGKIVRQFAGLNYFDYCAANGCLVLRDSPRVGSVVRVVDVKQDKEVHRWALDPRGHSIGSHSVSDDGKLIAVWFFERLARRRDLQAAPAANSFVEVFNAATGKPVGKLTEHQAQRVDVRFFPGGDEVLLVGGKFAGVWDVASSRPIKYPFTPETGGHYVDRQLQCISPDGRWMVLTVESTIEVWDRRTWLRTQNGHAQDRVQHVAVSPDSRLAATVADWHEVQLWRIEDGTPLVRHELPPLRVSEVAFSPDSKHLVFLEERDRRVHASGEPVRDAPPVLRVRDVDSGAVVREFDMPADCESVFAVSPVDEIAAVVSDNSVVLLDLLTGQPNKVLRPGEGHEVGGPMFSPNGAYLVGDTASEFHIWDVDTGVKLYTIKGRLPSAPRLAFSHTGNLFLPFAEKSTTEGTSTFTLYEAATGLPVQTLAIPGLSRGWDCFSPNPAKILTLTLKPPIRMPTLKDYSSNVWNLRTGAEERFTYQRWGVRWLCDIAPDGRHILSAGFAPITVWQTPQEMGRGQKAQVKLTREALTTNWEKLDANPELAFEAMFALAGGGESTVEFIRETVTPAKAVNAGEINQLIGTLESEEFLRREAAQDKLLLLKPHAERRLRAVLGESPSAELRARVEELLRAPRDVVRENSDEIAQIRAIQMLEWIGSDTARDVLKALAAGDPSHRQTLYAKQGIQRLQRSESVMK